MSSEPLVVITENNNLNEDETNQIRALISAITQADGLAPLSEHVLIHLHHGLDPRSRHLLAHSHDGELIGYLHLDQTDEVAGAAIEVAVHPDQRRHGVGSALVRKAIDCVGSGQIRLWAHGKNAAAHQLASTLEFQQTRELWQMRRSLFAPIPQMIKIPAIHIREFNPGTDDANWVEVNREIFINHPEQGTLTIDDLHIRMSESWFDAKGFFLATDTSGQIVGFVWTKIHGGVHHDQHDHPEIGEIYVVGVSEPYRNRGISSLLLIRAMEYLRTQNLPAVMLYVDADNQLAIDLYSKLGFTHWDTDVMFKRMLA